MGRLLQYQENPPNEECWEIAEAFLRKEYEQLICTHYVDRYPRYALEYSIGIAFKPVVASIYDIICKCHVCSS